jgi:hypothetical protein
MKYKEAMERVDKGFKVRRPHWAKDTYVSPMWLQANAMKCKHRLSWARHHNAAPFFPDEADLETTDWEPYNGRAKEK